MNIIFTALAALSGITGFSSGYFYETNSEHLQDCLFEHFGSCSSLATEDSFLLIDNLYAMDGISKNNHVHSDNYYATNKNLYICPDGDTYTQTDLSPSNYGLASAYYSNEQKKRFYLNNVEIRNYYSRTALISNNIVLSARKEGEGEAYMQYWFSREIRKYEFDISFYSTSDVLTISNSSIGFYTLTQKSDGSFDWIYKENLLEKNISSDRNNPTKMKYNFIDEEVYGFKFVVRAPATGTSNGGKVCIGLVSVQNATYDHGLFSNF